MPRHRPPALARLESRLVRPSLWTEAQLVRLRRLYDARPKLWWHVSRIVPAQLDLVEGAQRLRAVRRLTPPLLDAVATHPRPEELVPALLTALGHCSVGGGSRPWVTLEDAAQQVLRVEGGATPACAEVTPAFDLGDGARPLTTSAALRAEGRRMRSCLGQPGWWRRTVQRQGMAWVIQWEGERATAWVVPRPGPEGDTPATDMLLGPDNAPVSDGLRAHVEDDLQIALLGDVDPMEAEPHEQVGGSLAVLLGGTLSPVPAYDPMPRLPYRPRSLPSLPPAYWTESYGAFAQPTAPWKLERVPDPPPRWTARWDAAAGALIEETRVGRCVLRPGQPPTVELPTDAADPPLLWMNLDPTEDDDIPEADRAAMLAFVSALPAWLVTATRRAFPHDAMTGLCLLSSAPGLASVLSEHPPLRGPVLDRVDADPASVPALDVRLRGLRDADRAAEVLAWLGLPAGGALEAILPRLAPRDWTMRSLRRLAACLAAGPTTGGLLRRVNVVRPAHAAVLDAARRTGLLDRVTSALLADIQVTYGSPWIDELVGGAFADLEAVFLATGQRPPRLRHLSHLAGVLVAQRPRIPAPPPPPHTLTGPWGALVANPDDVALLALQLGHAGQAWRDAVTRRGMLCCVGKPAGHPTVTWLAPAGLCGELTLFGALGEDGRETAPAAQAFLRDALDRHAARVEELPPGWSVPEAFHAGLPAELEAVSPVGRTPLAKQVRELLELRG